MSLLIRTHIQLATSSLRRNRTRSFLTALGIAIGVASIVLILSLAGGINRLISTQIEKTGADLIVVRPSSGKDAVSSIVDELTASSQYQKSNLSFKDVTTIDKLDNIAAVAPLAISQATISVEHNKIPSATIVATTPDLPKILNLPLKNGQFLSDELKENTAVIGSALAFSLFGTTSAVTKTIHYLDEKFMVVGVLDSINDPINFNNVDFDTAMLVNASYLATLTDLQIQQINIKVAATDYIDDAIDVITEQLSASKSGEQNFAVLSGDKISHPAGSLFSIISGMLALVAGISLIVGGVGVMNIMLVSVSERTHEIGIRKAVGASSSNILLQFLFESIVLAVLGGIIGFALGYALAFLVSLITPFNPFISWEILGITGATSLTVGILFGIYPALKAARKNPIESLKYYR
ncbi:ABC transporter permease [Candidatus Saccharibacteria bacterium]|nr:ABC transporter permease [Candidatus Saccharibacteria bacterium]